MAEKIWDVHCHFPRNWEHPEASDHAKEIDLRADAALPQARDDVVEVVGDPRG